VLCKLEALLQVVVADDDRDLATEFVELDCVLHEMEHDLLVDLPVTVDVSGDVLGSLDLNLDLAVLEHAQERSQEAANQLRDRCVKTGELELQVPHVDLGLSHLRCDQERKKLCLGPDDAQALKRLSFFLNAVEEVEISLLFLLELGGFLLLGRQIVLSLNDHTV